MDVAVTGSSGLIGTALGPALEAAGHRMVKVVRHIPAGEGNIGWDPGGAKIDAAGLEGVGAVVNLAGVGIGDSHWSKEHKKKVLYSRVNGTKLLAETLPTLQNGPKIFLSASAVGYYGDRGDEVLTEASSSGEGFLAQVCREWEEASRIPGDTGIRVTNLRTGIVLAKHGGALKKMLAQFKFGLGGRFGSGRQWMSWITLADEVAAIVHLLGDGAPAGPVNLTAPNPVTNAEFAKALGRAMHRPTLFTVPAFALKLGLGREMGTELVLFGQRAQPEALTASGFTFGATDVATGLQQVLATS
jgi:uncharacterized protein (TIGR01777 family)